MNPDGLRTCGVRLPFELCLSFTRACLLVGRSGFFQYSASTVAGMLPCPVLRCINPGAAFVVSNQDSVGGYREAYVCVEHKAVIDAGSPWYMEGHSVLIGEDIPPVLETWSARPSVGCEGFTLTLHVAGHREPFEVFLTPAGAKTLAVFINATNNDSGHRRLTTL